MIQGSNLSQFGDKLFKPGRVKEHGPYIAHLDRQIEERTEPRIIRLDLVSVALPTTRRAYICSHLNVAWLLFKLKRAYVNHL